MKHLSGLLHKLTAVATVAVALTGCNRAEYTMLPKTSSAYHGTQRGVLVKPVPAPVAEEVPAAPVAATPTETAPVTVASPVAPAPAAQKATPATASKSTASAQVAPAPKLNFAQKALVAKLVKKADKLAAKAQVNKKSEAASKEDATALSRNIKLGLVLLLVGILVGLLNGVLGTIIAVIGIVFLVLGLLDEV